MDRDGQVPAPKKSAEDASGCVNDVQYELDGAFSRVTQLMTSVTRHQERGDHIFRGARQLQDRTDRFDGQLIEHLQMELLAYLNPKFP